nr:hypothetical protein CFP56_54262 [Quercus suber]
MLFTGEDEISGVDNVEHGDDEEEPNEGVSQAYLCSRCGQGEEKGWVENCSDLRDGGGLVACEQYWKFH